MFSSWLTPREAGKAIDAASVEKAICFNSSKKVPWLAHDQNEYVKEHYRPALLAIPYKTREQLDPNSPKELALLAFPTNIRAQICREVVADSRHTIIICAEAAAPSSEPGLTTVCQDIRDLALPAFYLENQFVVQIKHYDVQAVLPWLKRHESFQKEEEKHKTLPVMELPEPPGRTFWLSTYPCAQGEAWLKPYDILRAKEYARIIPAARSGSIIIHTDGEPNWANLQHWLKLAHAGEVVALKDDDFEGGVQDAAVKGAFSVIMGLKRYPWKIVAHTLPGLRQTLAAGDARWAADEASKAVVAQDPIVPRRNPQAKPSGHAQRRNVDESDTAAEDTKMEAREEQDETADDSGVMINDSEDDDDDRPRPTKRAKSTQEEIEESDDDDDDDDLSRLAKRARTEQVIDLSADDEDKAETETGEERMEDDEDSDADSPARIAQRGFPAVMEECRRSTQ
ncbi:hypothetical protein LTR85_001078 [Meristemomyces frigidus]|nr:hypothetical protein LTR85_001078 [Meristemomyces frigidus]